MDKSRCGMGCLCSLLSFWQLLTALLVKYNAVTVGTTFIIPLGNPLSSRNIHRYLITSKAYTRKNQSNF